MEPILGALRGKLINVLITDELTARDLVKKIKVVSCKNMIILKGFFLLLVRSSWDRCSTH